jgi:hypothetical protein
MIEYASCITETKDSILMVRLFSSEPGGSSANSSKIKDAETPQSMPYYEFVCCTLKKKLSL